MARIATNPVPSAIPDRVEDGIRATYINHATILIQVDGLNILTDPIWSERASPVTFAGPKRIRAPGIAISDLPEIDLVLISHNHYDHLDTATLKQLRQQQNKEPVIVSGLGNAALLRSLGYDQAIELDWSDSTTVENATVHFVECQHRSARGVFDQMRTLWGSFVIETSQGNIYFAGDTAIHHTSRSKVNALAPLRSAFSDRRVRAALVYERHPSESCRSRSGPYRPQQRAESGNAFWCLSTHLGASRSAGD